MTKTKEIPNPVESLQETEVLEQDSDFKYRRKLYYIISGIIVLTLISLLIWWFYLRQFVTTDDAFLEGNITPVSSKLTSQVIKIHVTENQYVKQGDLLIELNPQDAENKLAQAETNLQNVIANKNKAEANLLLTETTGRAKIAQAQANFQTSKNTIEQNRLVTSSKQNDVQQSRLQTLTAEASLRQAQSQIKAARSEIDKAEAQVNSAKTKYDTMRLNHDRNKKLFESGVISKQELDFSNKEMVEAEAALVAARKEVDIAESRYETAQRQVETEKARLNESKNRIQSAENDLQQSVEQINSSVSQADESAGRLQEANSLPTQTNVNSAEIEIAEAQINQAKAAVRQAETELGYTKIYATQNGYISRKSVQEGQIVQPGQFLLTITQGDIWVIANFKETQIEKMKEGQSVDIAVDAYPGVIFHGRIESFQAATGSRFSVLPTDNADGNFVKVVQRIPVKIIFNEQPDNKYLLVPGMSVIPKVRIR
jgi:membrane fusion protein (multidrug efflux system)